MPKFETLQPGQEEQKDIWGKSEEEELGERKAILETEAEKAQKKKEQETARKILEGGIQEGIVEEAAKKAEASRTEEERRTKRIEELKKDLLGPAEEDIWK